MFNLKYLFLIFECSAPLAPCYNHLPRVNKGFFFVPLRDAPPVTARFLFSLPPFSLIRDFSNQNACGNVSKISVNHTDDIPYMEMFHFTASGANFSKVKSFFEIIFTLASGLFVCG